MKAIITIDYIDRNELLRYLGYGDNSPDAATVSIIDECEKTLLSKIIPRYTFRRFKIESMLDNIKLENTSLVLKGNDIKKHLENCSYAILFCATVSSDVDMLIRTAQHTDMTRAVIYDAMASVAIEQVCNKVDEIIKNEYFPFNQTWRFSPGYGDFSIETQAEFLNTLDAQKKIGLNATKDSLLVPGKSVTAVIGLSEKSIQKEKRGCVNCNLQKKCAFRKRGEHCDF